MSNVRRRSGLGDYGEKPIRRYKLNAALSAGSSAQAYWVYWDTTAAAYVATDGEDERANQTFNLYSGPNNATGSSGDFGYCAYFSDRQQWEPIAGGGGASIAVGTLSATLSRGGSAGFTFTIGGSGTDTCWDPDMLCGSDTVASGATVAVAKISGKWYVIQASCPC